MKRFLTIFLCVCMLMLSACAGTSTEKDTDAASASSNESEVPVTSISVSEDEMLFTPTYDRVGEYVKKVNYSDEIYYSFLSASSNSDLTVKVKILAFVTDKANSYSTIFLAQILDVFKGDVKINDKIFIMQEGNSEATISGFMLFNIADTFLLNLKKDDSLVVNDQNVYSITNHFINLIQIYNYEGTDYIIDYCTEGFLDCFDLTPIKKDEAKEILKGLGKDELILNNAVDIKMYKYSDLEKGITILPNKNMKG